MNKVVIVTGASRGLGAAVAREVARLGAKVVLNARSAGELEEVAQQIRRAGYSALAVSGDVSDVAFCQSLVHRTVDNFGGLDSLVLNAGVIEPIAPIAEGSPDEWRRNLAVNVLGPMALIQAALPHLRVARGRVVSVSSGAAVNAIPGWAAYCGAKAALNQVNRVLAAEEESITAIAVRPGVVDTEMQAVIRQEGKKGMPASDHARFVRYQEEGELLRPELPGLAIAMLALHAPTGWSGEFLSWNDEKVQALLGAAREAPPVSSQSP